MATPGVKAISRGLFTLLIPFALIIPFQRLTGNESPPWLLSIIVGIALIAYQACRIVIEEHTLRRAAHLSGARLVPRVQGKWFANLDIPFEMIKHFETGYLGDGLDDLIAKYGTVFDARTLWTSMIFTSSPEHIQRILATDFDNFVKGERFKEQMNSMLGTGVFNADGEMWKFHRSMTRPFFTRDRITHFELFSEYSDYSIKKMKERVKEGYPVDFQDLMARFTLDVASEFLFGSCVDTLLSPLPYPHNAIGKNTDSITGDTSIRFAKAFLDVQEYLGTRSRLGALWPYMETFKDKTKEPMDVINAYLEPIIAAALAKKENRLPKEKESKDIEEDETLLDHLVELTLDPKLLKDETINILLAGRDTTASTLTFVVYFLGMYPHVMTRLRQEVLDKVGLNGKPTMEAIKDMKYLRAVINETLRLYPVVPFNIRESVKASIWPSPDPTKLPLYIPAGTSCSYSVFSMHRRKDLWGPDAEEFDPDRFLDERLKKYLTPKPFIFLPFNAGPRICLGQQFAYNEMSLMLVRLMQNFSSFTLAPEACPPECRPPAAWKTCEGRKGIDILWPKTTFTIYSAGGLWLRGVDNDV